MVLIEDELKKVYIENRKNKQRKEEFIEAVRPIYEWLDKYGNPYTIILVTQDKTEATDGFYYYSIKSSKLRGDKNEKSKKIREFLR